MIDFQCSGNVGKQPVMRETKKGEKVLSFSIAVDKGKKDGEKLPPYWVDCSLFGKRAVSLEPYINQGSKLSVTGTPSVRCYNDKAYQCLAIEKLTLMGSVSKLDEETAPQSSVSVDLDDEIPF